MVCVQEELPELISNIFFISYKSMSCFMRYVFMSSGHFCPNSSCLRWFYLRAIAIFLLGFQWWCVEQWKSILVQFRSVVQSCPTLCDPMNSSTPGLPVHHKLPEFTQTHVHRVSDAIQPSHPLSSPSPPAPNPSQHHSLFQWVNSSHEVAKVLEFQL